MRARSLRGTEARDSEERNQTAAKEAARLVLNDGNSPRSKHRETMRVRCLQRFSSSTSVFFRTQIPQRQFRASRVAFFKTVKNVP